MTKKTAYYGVFIALAFILSYVESLFPITLGVPGIKLGLGNLVVIVVLYIMGPKDAFILSIVRIILAGFTFGNLYSMFYSLAGGLLSLGVMLSAKRTKLFSEVGVSILGGVFHNIGQILIAAFIVHTAGLFYYLPMLMIAGAAAGLFIGILGAMIIKRIKNRFD